MNDPKHIGFCNDEITDAILFAVDDDGTLHISLSNSGIRRDLPKEEALALRAFLYRTLGF